MPEQLSNAMSSSNSSLIIQSPGKELRAGSASFRGNDEGHGGLFAKDLSEAMDKRDVKKTAEDTSAEEVSAEEVSAEEMPAEKVSVEDSGVSGSTEQSATTQLQGEFADEQHSALTQQRQLAGMQSLQYVHNTEKAVKQEAVSENSESARVFNQPSDPHVQLSENSSQAHTAIGGNNLASDLLKGQSKESSRSDVIPLVGRSEPLRKGLEAISEMPVKGQSSGALPNASTTREAAVQLLQPLGKVSLGSTEQAAIVEDSVLAATAGDEQALFPGASASRLSLKLNDEVTEASSSRTHSSPLQVLSNSLTGDSSSSADDNRSAKQMSGLFEDIRKRAGSKELELLATTSDQSDADVLTEIRQQQRVGGEIGLLSDANEAKAGIMKDMPVENVLRSLASGTMAALSSQKTEPSPAPSISAPQTVSILADDADTALASNVKWMAKEGIQNATVTVSPSGMGPISVKVGLDHEQMSISITASQHTTREALEALLPRLREQLSSLGHESVKVDVSDGRGEQSRSGSGQAFAEQRQSLGAGSQGGQSNAENNGEQSSNDRSDKRADANERFMAEDLQRVASTGNGRVHGTAGFDAYV